MRDEHQPVATPGANQPIESSLTRFVILATPRSGSNWLCTLLDSHPEILCHHELFNPDGIHYSLRFRQGALRHLGCVQERDRDPLAFLERCLAIGLGHRVVGFKLNRGQAPAVFEQVLSDPSLKKILLTRANEVRAFVSEKIAEMTGCWESYSDSDLPEDPVSIRVEIEELKAHIAGNRKYLNSLLTRMAKQKAHRVLYEDLSASAARRGILEFLGVSGEVSLQGATRKQNPQGLQSLIKNYEDVEAALQGSPLAEQLRVESQETPEGQNGARKAECLAKSN